MERGGGHSPSSRIRKSPLSLDFVVGKAVKNFLPHVQDFLVPAVSNSCAKTLPSITHAPPFPWLGRWEPGILLLLAMGGFVGAVRKSIHGRLVQVTHNKGPQLHSAGGGAVAVVFNRSKKMENVVTGEDNYSEALSELN